MKLFSLLLIFLTSFLHAEDVSIQNETLKGELTSVGTDKSLIAFIISGSGPTDRDGNTVGSIGKNNSLLYLSNYLNKEGISTLRIDKRGVGVSTSSAIKEDDLRFSTYVEDVGHWIDFLKKRGYSKIVLIGHSEGALVATLAASSDSVIGLVSIAGAGRPASVVLKEQLQSNLPKELYTQAESIISSLEKGETVKNTPPELSSLFRSSVQPYLISWLKIDPAKAVSEVEVPILIVQGSTDLQISIEDAKLLHTGAKESELHIIQGMNHVLKAAEGNIDTQITSYIDPTLPLHKDLGAKVLKLIINASQNPAYQVPFTEPTYPEGADVKLLRELVLFFDERRQPIPKKDWDDFLLKMSGAKLPRLATKTDLKNTKDQIENISKDPVLFVARHLNPMVPQRTMNLEGVKYRTYWLKPNTSIKISEVAFRSDLTILLSPRILTPRIEK
jgi:uncharacterized protein